MLKTLTAIAVAACLLAPAGAAASPSSARTDRMLGEFVSMGETFWHARGVQPCPTPLIDVSALPGADGVTNLGGCRIWVSKQLVQAAGRERWSPHHNGDSERDDLCTTVFHELGHTAGLGHTATGLMSPMGATVPYQCRAWRMAQDRVARAAWRGARFGGRAAG